MSRFTIYPPSPFLQPYVKQYAISETVDAQQYNVLPEMGLVMGFQFYGSLSLIEKAEILALAPSGITGFSSSFKTFKNTTKTGSLLIYFTETGASHFFKIPLHELFSKSLPLDGLVFRSLCSTLEEQLAETTTDAEKIALAEHFLRSQYYHDYIDPLVMQAVNLIKTTKGKLKIHELTNKLNTSQSPLEKRFRRVVGATPKKFSSVIRLISLLETTQSYNTLMDSAEMAGYYDQAHFIKDFKSFTGTTPEKFFTVKNS